MGEIVFRVLLRSGLEQDTYNSVDTYDKELRPAWCM